MAIVMLVIYGLGVFTGAMIWNLKLRGRIIKEIKKLNHQIERWQKQQARR